MRSLNGTQFANMVLSGADSLHSHVDHVNALNVFPVPDGDTGTNMNLTMTAGVKEIKDKRSASISKTAEILSKGLLMGARGNSGVILSQLFRGFSRGVAGLDEVNAVQFAHALQSGVDTAYKAVVKPVEGTILTVAKDAAKHAVHIARRTPDIQELVREVLAKANESLQHTPELLPVLKQVGVVDSGGQGLVYIYEGFLRFLESGATQTTRETRDSKDEQAALIADRVKQLDANQSAQAKLHTEDIEFLYDMEFFIDLTSGTGKPYNEEEFEKALAKNGDSIILIADDEIVKVHVHSRRPGEVFDLAMAYGELTRMHILNMREQHRELLHGEHEESSDQDGESAPAEVFAEMPAEHEESLSLHNENAEPPADEIAAYGFIAVAMGDGIKDIYQSLGVDVVLSGGQTMNPSTQDFIEAIETISAQHIIILPNNSNIIMAAKQAAEIVERDVTVLETKTIPQGIAAAFAFQEEESLETNVETMQEAVAHVKSGQVTYAVRDTQFDDLEIKAGNFIGIFGGKIVATTEELTVTCEQLLSKMLETGGEIITILTGEDAKEDETASLVEWVEEHHPDVEVEVHTGGQPIYSYIISVE